MSLSAQEIKIEYIEMGGPAVNRYGPNKLINLTNFLPQYIQQTDTNLFVELFQNYLNEMFPGEHGFNLSAVDLVINKLYVTQSGTSGGISGTEFDINDRNFTFDFGTSSTSAVPTDANNEVKKIIINLPENYNNANSKISILEKIKRLTELQDPDLIPLRDVNSTSGLDFISLLGRNLGYQVDISRTDMKYTGEIGNLAYLGDTFSDIDVSKYLRFMVSNLPNWYKIKTTQNSIKVLLYSFGLIGDINPLYTQDYDKYWKIYGDNELEDIPDNYYPTPHFAVRIDIDDIVGEISFDNERRNNVIDAIKSIKPVNNVFEGINGYMLRKLPINVFMNTRIKLNLVIT